MVYAVDSRSESLEGVDLAVWIWEFFIYVMVGASGHLQRSCSRKGHHLRQSSGNSRICVARGRTLEF